jgi:hypothetical protein
MPVHRRLIHWSQSRLICLLKKGEGKQVSSEDAISSGRFGDIRIPEVGGFTGYSKLSQAEKNWLWHHHFACRNLRELRQMQNHGVFGGIEVKGELIG